MRVLKNNNKLRTNAEMETQDFGIGDMSIVINLLTNLYSNPKQTLTQEYISNARDANREAKTTKPIEITAPTSFKPTMRIRDFGLGLSPDRIKNVFLRYGKSTKSESNDQTGGFGIGGKSAWAYTDSFIIHSFHEGLKYTYAAIKAENKPTLNLIEKTLSDEPSGVCIEVAVASRDIRDFQKAIVRSTKYWDKSEKPVIKGISDEHDYSNVKVTKKLGALQVLDNSRDHSYYVIDGIPYKIDRYNAVMRDSKQLGKLQNNYIINIPVGAVTIAPSREELIFDKKTEAYLKTIIAEISQALAKNVKDKFKTCTNLAEYLAVFNEVNSYYRTEFGYKSYGLGYRHGLEFNKGENDSGYSEFEVLKDWAKLATLNRDDRVHKGKCISIKPEELDFTYYVDVQESGVITNRRIKNLLENHHKQVIILTNLPAHFVKNLALKGISSIDPVEVVKVAKDKAVPVPLGQREIVMWRYRAERFKIDSLDQIIYTTSDKRLSMQIEMSVLKNLYFISKSTEKMIADLPNFVKYEDWLKTAELNEKQKNYVLTSELRKTTLLVIIIINSYTKTKYTNDTLNDLSTKVKSTECGALVVLVERYKQTKEYKDLTKLILKLDKRLTDKCPMISHVRQVDDTVVNYVNKNF